MTLTRAHTLNQTHRLEVRDKIFFLEKFSNLRTPHALYIAGLDTSKISGVSAWKNFKQLAKESAGIRSEEYHGLPPVYLKFNPRDPKNSVLYKYSSFEGSSDFGDGEISSTAFLEAYRRAKKSLKSHINPTQTPHRPHKL